MIIATADTITDEQIRRLKMTALTAQSHIDCDVALRARREMLTSSAGRLAAWYPTTKDRRAARARLAAVVNARAKAGAQ